jgi:hypothetical protein
MIACYLKMNIVIISLYILSKYLYHFDLLSNQEQLSSNQQLELIIKQINQYVCLNLNTITS